MGVRACVCCGHVFVSEARNIHVRGQRSVRHRAVADEVPILSTQECWLPIDQSEFRLHRKQSDPNAPPTLRVEHYGGLSAFSEFISFESVNIYARQFAQKWWHAMGGQNPVR